LGKLGLWVLELLAMYERDGWTAGQTDGWIKATFIAPSLRVGAQ